MSDTETLSEESFTGQVVWITGASSGIGEALAKASLILQGLVAGVEEIAVGGGPEMGLLELQRQDATSTFRLLESMAQDILGKRQGP